MKTKELIFFFLKRGAVLYTAISLPLFVVLSIISTESTPPIAPEKFLLVAILAYVMSLGATLYRVEAFSTMVARIVHASCFILGFFTFTFFILADFSSENLDLTQDFTSALIATAVFAIIYAATCVIAALIKNKTSVFSLSASGNSSSGKTSNATSKKTEKKPTRPKKSKREEDTYTNRFS